jgi:DTW domain-containing protein
LAANDAVTAAIALASRGFRLPRCARCGLVAPACFCAEVTPVPTLLKLQFVMHHLELNKVSNSVRLIGCTLQATQTLLIGCPAARTPPAIAPGSLMLFPALGGRPLTHADAGRTLLVPDGSWSQARKIAQSLLRDHSVEPIELAAGALAAGTPLTLRKPKAAGLVATAQAVAAALYAVGDMQAGDAILQVFQRFTAAGFATRGRRSAHWMT